jgi:hypothetical protein
MLDRQLSHREVLRIAASVSSVQGRAISSTRCDLEARQRIDLSNEFIIEFYVHSHV